MRIVQTRCLLIALLMVAGLGGGALAAGAQPITPAVDHGASAGGLWLVASHPVTGLWQGTTRAYCGTETTPSRCNAVQKITLDLRQTAARNFTGTYSCAYGNMICRNDNQHGKLISGDYMPGRTTFRIQLSDGSTCMFNGNFANSKGSGVYECTYGGSFVEQGMWQVSRTQ